MKPATPRPSAFTLVELSISVGVAVIAGMVFFTLLNVGMTLYAQNMSINQTQSRGMLASEKLLVKVAAAVEAPSLVDDTGATISGNGPAAGIRYLVPASAKTYSVPTAVGATATSFTMAKSTGQPAPQVGDTISAFDLGFRGVITTVVPAGSNYTVGFASTVGSGFTPAKTTGTVIPAGSKCFLLSPAAFISVSSTLRYYPRAMSVAQQGATTFNNSASFDAVTTLVPVTSQTNCFPFQYLGTASRSIDVTLRVRSPAYGSKIKGFYAFQNIKTTVACRSLASL